MKSLVSLTRCIDYASPGLDKALAAAIESAGGLEVRGASVLVKPNLLNANGPERAVSTQPELVAATVRWLKAAGASRVLVGDSPAFQTQDLVGRKSGVREAAESAGATWVDCSTWQEVENPEGSLVKRFNLASPFVESDILFNLPRLKTHQLMYLSGAIKNLFGLIPGLQKSAFHLRFPGRPEFASMLADLCLAANPDFSLMDGVVAMEGPGPNNGKPRRLDLLLASKDPLALDATACRVVGYEALAVPYISELLARGASTGLVRQTWIGALGDIELTGLPLEEARVEGFELVPVLRDTDIFKGRLPAFVHRIVKGLAVPRPAFDHKKCVRCGACIRICPAKALEYSPGPRPRVEIDYASCLRCYCCHEVCPEDAIRLVRRPS